MEEQQKNGELVLYFLDEAGFSLQPVVPYGWQKRDTLRGCTSGSHHRRLNVIGMMQCNGDFDSYMIEGSVNVDVVIACIDAFIRRVRRDVTALPIVLVLDNASIHKGEIDEHRQQWLSQGVSLKYIPPYSPELNKIEILWRRMKYQWLSIDATESWEALDSAVEHVLKGVGSEYQITFT